MLASKCKIISIQIKIILKCLLNKIMQNTSNTGCMVGADFRTVAPSAFYISCFLTFSQLLIIHSFPFMFRRAFEFYLSFILCVFSIFHLRTRLPFLVSFSLYFSPAPFSSFHIPIASGGYVCMCVFLVSVHILLYRVLNVTVSK